jgi:hypothetical protein
MLNCVAVRSNVGDAGGGDAEGMECSHIHFMLFNGD